MYHAGGGDYFEKRGLKRHVGVFSLWALGVGTVISGEFSGRNLGFAEGDLGGMFVGTIIIAVMYLGLTFSIAEMSQRCRISYPRICGFPEEAVAEAKQRIDRILSRRDA
jgi:hypothetical protein